MKQTILTFLEDHKDQYVSGELIANSLHMTRANVWKNIEKLREDGITIEAISRKGYKLVSTNDALSTAQLHLKGNLVDEIIILDEVDSTNDYAKRIAETSPNTLIIANHQSKGKGRRGKAFYSPSSEGIYMSLLLKPTLTIEDTPFLTIISAIACVEGIQEALGIVPSIKWLNDIYIGKLKLAGILTEAQITLENARFEYVIIGMGINTHTTQIPKELEGIYTALDAYTKTVDRNKLISTILNRFSEYYDMLPESNEEIIEIYKSYNFVLNDIVYVDDQKYTAIDINQSGHLVVQDDNGTIRNLNAEEISIRSPK